MAPPLSFAGLESIASCTKDKLFIVGDHDQYCSVAQLTVQLARVAEPKQYQVIAGADHFFAGFTPAVAEGVRSFCASLVAQQVAVGDVGTGAGRPEGGPASPRTRNAVMLV